MPGQSERPVGPRDRDSGGNVPAEKLRAELKESEAESQRDLPEKQYLFYHYGFDAEARDWETPLGELKKSFGVVDKRLGDTESSRIAALARSDPLLGLAYKYNIAYGDHMPDERGRAYEAAEAVLAINPQLAFHLLTALRHRGLNRLLTEGPVYESIRTAEPPKDDDGGRHRSEFPTHLFLSSYLRLLSDVGHHPLFQTQETLSKFRDMAGGSMGVTSKFLQAVRAGAEVEEFLCDNETLDLLYDICPKDVGLSLFYPDVAHNYLDCLTVPENSGILADKQVLYKIASLPILQAAAVVEPFRPPKDEFEKLTELFSGGNVQPLQREKSIWVLALPPEEWLDAGQIVNMARYVDVDGLNSIKPPNVLNQLLTVGESQFREKYVHKSRRGEAQGVRLSVLAYMLKQMGSEELRLAYAQALGNPDHFDSLSDAKAVLALVNPGQEHTLSRDDDLRFQVYFTALAAEHDDVAKLILDEPQVNGRLNREGVEAYRRAMEDPAAREVLGDRSIWDTFQQRDFTSKVVAAYFRHLADGDRVRADFILGRHEPFLYDDGRVADYMDVLTADEVQALSEKPELTREELRVLAFNRFFAENGFAGPLTEEQARGWDERIVLRGRKFIVENELARNQLDESYRGRWSEYCDGLEGNAQTVKELAQLGVDTDTYEKGLGPRSYRVGEEDASGIEYERAALRGQAGNVIRGVLAEGENQVLRNPRRMLNTMRESLGLGKVVCRTPTEFIEQTEDFIADVTADEERTGLVMKAVMGLLQDDTKVLSRERARTLSIHAEDALIGLGEKPVKVRERLDTVEVELSDKDPKQALTNGNDSGDCKRLGAGDEAALPFYLRDKAFGKVELSVGARRVGQAWCFAGKVAGKPVLIVDCVDVGHDMRGRVGLYGAALDYIREWGVKSKFRGVIMGTAFNNASVYAQGRFSVETIDLEKIDHFNPAEYPFSYADTMSVTWEDDKPKVKGGKPVYVLESIK